MGENYIYVFAKKCFDINLRSNVLTKIIFDTIRNCGL